MIRYLFILFSVFTIVSCNDQAVKKAVPSAEQEVSKKQIPNIEKDKSALRYENKTSQWFLNDKLFSGYAMSRYENDTLLEKMGILNGKKQNECTKWYPDGRIQSTANYKQGKLHGKKQVWNADEAHTLIASLNFENGKAEGEQKKWYPTGEPYQILHMKAGREEGVQQAFRKNGALYANYEAKNGRIFGMKKAALCFGLEDQKIKNED